MAYGVWIESLKDTTSQPAQPLSQDRLLTPPTEPPILPTPETTPQLDSRDASPAPCSIGSTTPTPDAPLQTGTSSPAQQSLDVSHSDSSESHDRTPVEITRDTIVVQPLTTRRRPSSDGLSMQPDTQPSSDPQPVPARGETRTRRSPRELYGDQPTRKSNRTPKPTRKHIDYGNNAFTALLPAEQLPEGNLATFHSVFLAAVSKTARDHRFHRDDLVRLPKRYQDLEHHPMGPEFKEAIRKELHDLLRRGTWRLVERDKARAAPLPLKWVFNYKFDQDGYLQRCKARVCVRGDLQDDDGGLETYAATLAAKTFRVIMATAARFDLEVQQFDVSNALLYSDLKTDQPYLPI